MDLIAINSDNYAQAAVRTEAPYEGTRERLNNIIALGLLGRLMADSVELGQHQDTLKKFLFYGKQNLAAEMAEKAGPGLDDYEDVYARLVADPRILRLVHAVIGLQTEAAELQQALADHIFVGKPLDYTNISEETGDVFWYCGIIADVLKKSVGNIMTQNIAKLAKRYGDKFTEFAANNRNLDAERAVLEDKPSEQLNRLDAIITEADKDDRFLRALRKWSEDPCTHFVDSERMPIPVVEGGL